MSTEVIIPKAGMGSTEGTIVKWLKAEGDSVTQGEVLAEIETAKAVEEILSPATGVLSTIMLPEGETAEVHTVIALIEERS
jgi:pyruvate/2-oxoglutarate dehydrogenase complex dihydrolipoamide acyltransferase (E2) component